MRLLIYAKYLTCAFTEAGVCVSYKILMLEETVQSEDNTKHVGGKKVQVFSIIQT